MPALLERELIGEGRNIHGDTGIGVPVPGPADTVAGFDHEVVAESRPVELDCGADPGEPGADDQCVVVGHHRLLPITCTPCLGRRVSVASSST
ncbi:Uncharacterised protein [Mycobacterium tuberculosis]|nr:Uncharacterised protein [Mycobacterium tuberculosis]